MDARVLITVAEYLHTSFDGPDREYVDGEVVERNMGELPHARLQAELFYRLRNLANSLGLQVLPEIRIQVSPTRFRGCSRRFGSTWPTASNGCGSSIRTSAAR